MKTGLDSFSNACSSSDQLFQFISAFFWAFTTGNTSRRMNKK
jgi:hypothetical protein